jgi:hypothetical protein
MHLDHSLPKLAHDEVWKVAADRMKRRIEYSQTCTY